MAVFVFMRKIGIYGGTFNPIHNGHLQIVNDFIEKCELDVCFIIPNSISPFKTHESKVISDEHRIKMIELSILENPKIEIDLFEINKQGISYTLDTINYLQNKFPEDKLFILIGGDSALKFHKWYKWEEILKLVKVVIASRNYEKKDFDFLQICPECQVIFLENELINISASEIREFIENCVDFSQYLPEKICNYIKNNKLYE